MSIDKFPNKRRLVNSRSLFAVSIFVAIVTTMSIWLLGLGVHRTLFINSLLSVSILSAGFLVFIVSGLYRGIKLRDDVVRITDKFRLRNFDINGAGDVGGCVDGESIFAWLAATIIAILLIWLLENALWFLTLIFIAMLYWIFFRALRLIFKKSSVYKGDFLEVWVTIMLYRFV